MCKQHFTTQIHQVPDTCYLSQLYEKMDIHPAKDYRLPIDGQGLCLFHSQDMAWKIEHQFEEQLDRLLKYHLNPDSVIEDIDFRNFHFVTKDAEAILWEDLVVSKPFNICGATFQVDFKLKNCQFIGDFFIDSTHFHGEFLVHSCEFVGNFTATDQTTFHRAIQFSEVNFVGFYEVRHAFFLGQVNLSNVTFQSHSLWDSSVFNTGSNGINYFNFSTNDYTSFKKVQFVDIVEFEQCIFKGDAHFDKTRFENALFFTKPIIESSIFFKGTEDEMIFQNEVKMELNDQTFVDVGQIVFEYANLLNLDKKTKKQLTRLKTDRKVNLGKGTIVFRISFQEKYDYSDFDDIFLRDLLTTIQQYFKRNLNHHFEFVLSREGKKIIVTFYTDDYATPDDFKQDTEKMKEKLTLSIQENVEDIAMNYLRGKFKYQLFSAIQAALKKKINIEFIKQLLNEKSLNVILNHPEIKAIHTKTLKINTVTDTKIYVEKLMGLKNNPSFEMNDQQFAQIKTQLLNLENEKWQELMKLVQAIYDNQEDENTLGNFLSETGISIANNTSAGILMILVDYLLRS